MGDQLWQLGANGCFGLYAHQFGGGTSPAPICLSAPIAPDFLTSTDQTLITAQCVDNDCGTSQPLAFRTYDATGARVQYLKLLSPAGTSEINGIAYRAETQTLVLADRSTSNLYFYDVVFAP